MRNALERLEPGQSLGARHVNRMVDEQSASTLVPTDGSTTTLGAMRLRPVTRLTAYAVSSYLRPFDITDKTATTFSILPNHGDVVGVQILGQRPAVSAGTGFTWSTDRWTSATVTASGYVYLEVDRANGTAKILMGATLPNGTDSVRYVALWYIPFSAGAIVWTEVVERPEVFSIEGMV